MAKIAIPDTRRGWQEAASWVSGWSCDRCDGTNRELTMGVVCRRSGAGYGSHPWSHGDGHGGTKGAWTTVEEMLEATRHWSGSPRGS